MIDRLAAEGTEAEAAQMAKLWKGTVAGSVIRDLLLILAAEREQIKSWQKAMDQVVEAKTEIVGELHEAQQLAVKLYADLDVMRKRLGYAEPEAWSKQIADYQQQLNEAARNGGNNGG
jgi:flagellar biosynthesis/type III secretory pathway chaperone